MVVIALPVSSVDFGVLKLGVWILQNHAEELDGVCFLTFAHLSGIASEETTAFDPAWHANVHLKGLWVIQLGADDIGSRI